MQTRTWMGVATVAGVLAVAGCGGGSTSTGSSGGSGSGGSGASTSGSGSSGGGGSTLKLAANPNGKLAFNKKQLTAKAGQVTIDFTNQSSVPHAVEIEGKGVEKETKTLTTGSATLTANLKPGTYEFYCPVDGHRQAGMEGTLVVK